MIIQTLQKLTDTGEQVYAKVCTVRRADKETKCCDLAPIDGSAELFEVSFQPDVQGGGLLPISCPKQQGTGRIYQ
jgi:hypothetical protein